MKIIRLITPNKLLSFAFCISLFSSIATAEDTQVVKDQKMAVLLIQAQNDKGGGRGTGFACSYRGQEFIATNIHVIEGASSLVIRPQTGENIRLSGRMIVAEDADICLLGIVGDFKEAGITPLEFMEDVFAESKAGDEIACLGNSLGSGVITATLGTIKAYGQPRLEIISPVVQGNSGGPIIHQKTGKVVGLVTEAIVNKTKLDELATAADKSEDSPLSDISYFGHRIDSVGKWSGTNFKEYQERSQLIANAGKGLERALLFLLDEDGWEGDRRLDEAWKNYKKFIDTSNARTTRRTEVTNYVNELGVVVRRDSRVKGLNVAESDYVRAREAFQRAVEWKILADKEVIERSKPVGYLQTAKAKNLLDFASKVLTLHKEL